MLSAVKIAMVFGDRILFTGASFTLHRKNCYGLVGSNGSGKSTLLKLLSNKLPLDEGELTLENQMQVGILEQDVDIYNDLSLLDVVMQARPVLQQAVCKKDQLLEQGSTLTLRELDELARLEEIITSEGGYVAISEAQSILHGMGFPAERQHEPLSKFSGGFKMRVLMAKLLFGKPDLLLLDEPTNHLDLPTIKWLESYLKANSFTSVIVSHDREFLSRVSTHIIDIDYGDIKVYRGNYEDFVRQKEEEISLREHRTKVLEKRQKEVGRFIERFRAKSSKARQAGSRKKLLEKLNEESASYALLPTSRVKPRFSFSIERPSASIALKVKDLAKSYKSNKLFSKLSFEIERGERVAIVGANGMGKTTLVNILNDPELADAGEVKWGYHTKLQYITQEQRAKATDMNLLQWLESACPGHLDEEVRETLAAVLFGQEEIKKKVNVLSGGELARLSLAKAMLLEPNCLILDEPTNHLDLEAVEALIEALIAYKGTLIVVSHNRYLLYRIATRVIEIKGDRVIDYKGSYKEFCLKFEEIPKAKQTTKKAVPPLNTRAKRAFQQRQVEQVERKCAHLEQKINELDQLFSGEHFYEETSLERQRELSQKREELESELKSTYSKWEMLLQELESL